MKANPRMDAIEALIADPPHLHAWPDGKPANWAVAPAVLQFLFQQLKPKMRTLETGAGHTTIAFAAAKTEHVCITPDRRQADRIRRYCADNGFECTATFIHESSDIALASGKGIPEALEFVLIDGAHRFPFPILDWHFTAPRLQVGGIVVVDDYPMPSVRILHDFLMGEDEWELIKKFHVTSFFRRTRATTNDWDWADQKINKPHLEMQARRLATNRQPHRAARLLRKLVGA